MIHCYPQPKYFFLLNLLLSHNLSTLATHRFAIDSLPELQMHSTKWLMTPLAGMRFSSNWRNRIVWACWRRGQKKPKKLGLVTSCNAHSHPTINPLDLTRGNTYIMNWLLNKNENNWLDAHCLCQIYLFLY